jgi:DNA-binding transcriptional ArsR family regulator
MEADPLSTTFAALADPTRRAILSRLTQGSATVKELSAPFRISGPAISKHLRVLERAGLISQGRDAQFRPCQLEAAPLKAVADYTESYRRFWEERFDRLQEYLEELQKPVSVRGSSCEAITPLRRSARAGRVARRETGAPIRGKKQARKLGRARKK